MFLFRESAWVNDFAQDSHLKQNIQLKEHITAVHEKRFNCDQCGKIFARGCNLKVLIQNVWNWFMNWIVNTAAKISLKHEGVLIFPKWNVNFVIIGKILEAEICGADNVRAIPSTVQSSTPCSILLTIW